MRADVEAGGLQIRRASTVSIRRLFAVKMHMLKADDRLRAFLRLDMPAHISLAFRPARTRRK